MVQLLEAELRFTGTPEEWVPFAWTRAIGTVYDEIRSTKPYGFRKLLPSDQRKSDTPLVPVISSLSELKRVGDSSLTIEDSIHDPTAIIDHDPVEEQKLSDAVAALSADHRTVVEMLIDEDCTLEELGKALGITASAVHHTRSNIRKQLIASLAHPMPRARALRLLRSESFLRHRVRQGYSQREIAAELGVHRSSIREKMQMHGIKSVNRPGRRPD